MKRLGILLAMVLVLGISLTGCITEKKEKQKEEIAKTKQEIRVENFNRIFGEALIAKNDEKRAAADRQEGVYLIKNDSSIRFYPLDFLGQAIKTAFIQDLTAADTLNVYFVFNNRAGSLDDSTIKLSDFIAGSAKTAGADTIITKNIFNVQTNKTTMPDGTEIKKYITFSNKVADPILAGYFNNVTVAIAATLPVGAEKIEFRDMDTDLVWDRVTVANGTLSKSVVRTDVAAVKVKVVILDVAGNVLDSTVSDLPGSVVPSITGLTITENTATVNENEAFALPTTATALMSDGTTKVAALTWDAAVSTTKAGLYTFKGSTAGTTLTVKFTLTVIAVTTNASIKISDIGNSLKTGEEFVVTISAVNVVTAVSATDIRIKYNPIYLSIDMSSGVTLLMEDTGFKIIKENTSGEIIITFSPKDTNINNKNLATLKFKALKSGTTELSLGSDTVMLNTANAQIGGIDISDKSAVTIEGGATTSKLLINDGAAVEGNTTEITLTGKDFTEMTKGIDVTLNYDAAYLTVEDAVNSVTLLGTLAGGSKIVNASAGKIRIAAVLYGTAVTSNQELVKVKFKALKEGKPTITIASAEITNEAGTAVINDVDATDTGIIDISKGNVVKKLDISESAALNAGETVTLKVNASNITDAVASMDIRVKYDPAYLSLDVNTGIVLLIADTGFKIIKENTVGEAIITFAPKDTNIVDKDIMTITFKTLKAGTTGVSLGSSTMLLDSALNSISIDKTDVSNLTINGDIVPVVTKVTLTADKTTIKPDGTENAVLTAKVFDQNGNVMTGETVTITKDGAAFTGTTFSSAAAGSFAFVAKSGNVSSDTLTIKAETVIVTSGYSTNGKGVGKNKTITIDGKNTSSEWTDDMLIATALAGDDPRTLGSSWSMHETPWNGTHMWAAWDDSNLYVAWQYVDVTDIADPSNAGSSTGTRIFGMDLIQWLAFDTKSGSGASIDMWGKNGGKPYWTGADKPETQIYVASNFTQGYICNAVNDVFVVPPVGVVSADYKKFISSGGYNYSTGGIQNKQILTAGFDAGVGKGFAGTSLTGVKDADDRLTETSYINMLTGHDTTRDTFYEIKIPLSELKITKADLETNGLGVMIGQGEFSCMDTLPNDSATSDTKTVSDSNSPLEWADVDSLSVPFARVGHTK